MKKIFAILSAAALLASAGCSKDFLETNPTDKTSGPVIFESGESALVALNGIYRLMYSGGWTDGWEAENGGLAAYNMLFDLYAEDHIMDSAGSGWFYYDYAYNTWTDYEHTAGHSYGVWNFFYTLVCNANYIIANEADLDETAGDYKTWQYVLGQAYSIRAFSYMWLVQAYQQNGGAAGSETRNLPGVPLYSEPTVAGTVGKGRGTVQDVYTQSNSDIDKAIDMLKQSGMAQQHISHIGLNVAYGLKARFALVQRDYATALEAAENAMAGTTVAEGSSIAHINDATASNVMWGLAIQKDHSISSWDIYSHMDADSKSTYSKARHLIGNWLYNQIPEGDARLAWWTAPLPEEEWGAAGSAEGSKRSWCQKKLVWKDAATTEGDHVIMRGEEIYLMAAEAACHLQQYGKAKTYIKKIGDNRMGEDAYAARLAKFTESSEYNEDTVGKLTTLMDEILFQRRVELWGELPRMFDLQRLDLGFHRDWEDSNHTELLNKSKFITTAHSPQFILWLPQSEFDGNENMDSALDQNPSFQPAN